MELVVVVLLGPLLASLVNVLPHGFYILGGWLHSVSNHRANLVAALILLRLHRRKVILQGLLSLDTTIGDLANLVAIELCPLGSIILVEEVHNENGINEVDEGITHVAVVLEVNRQIEKVIVVLLGPIYRLQEHLLGVLVGNVLNHDCRPIILAIQNVVDVQSELHFSVVLVDRIVLPRLLIITDNSLLRLIEVDHHEEVHSLLDLTEDDMSLINNESSIESFNIVRNIPK